MPTTPTVTAWVNPFEVEVREFVREFPTPNALLAVEHAEAGRLTWEQVHGLFEQALRAGLKEVRDGLEEVR